jgi:uncharacterized protein
MLHGCGYSCRYNLVDKVGSFSGPFTALLLLSLGRRVLPDPGLDMGAQVMDKTNPDRLKVSDRAGVRRLVEDAQGVLADSDALGDVDQLLSELGQAQGALTEADLEQLAELARLAATRGGDKVAESLLRRDGQLRLSVTDDGMQVRGRIEPPRAGGNAVGVDQVVEMLSSQGLDRGMDRAAIEAAVRQAAEQQAPVDFVAAAGRPATAGKPAQYELYARRAPECEPQRIKLTEPNCQLDHPMLCMAGDLILRRLAAEPGVAGYDVFGAPLPAPSVSDLPIHVGRHVRGQADVFHAEVSGQVVLAGGRLEVNRVRVLTEDVTRNQGEILFDGDIEIRAAVRSGAVVKASGHVTVQGAVEDAEIESTGGNVTLRHGVAGRYRGRITAAGDVVTRFAENVTITAGGDLTVLNGALHSRLAAGRRLSVLGGRGQLIGGVAMAGQVIEARQIGATSGVATQVIVGLERQAMDALAELENEIAWTQQRAESAGEVVERLQRTVGDATRLDPRTLEIFTRVRKIAIVCTVKLRQLRQRRDDLLVRSAASSVGHIEVHHMMLPGVTVRIGSAEYLVRDAIRRARMVFDERQMTVAVHALGK